MEERGERGGERLRLRGGERERDPDRGLLMRLLRPLRSFAAAVAFRSATDRSARSNFPCNRSSWTSS